ncbi:MULTISPECIES: DMT family transporter [Halocynthiibacter]|uniref:DMT family transporter n=1 Tax=Halocynthiibacter halioticoli TaxID=2986804 RepID=A0AAE3IW21_9RHOB|nr:MULTISPECIES: DMT family transporter [Halocynthiibacter]MCV6823128.1 DMT family transporter [Halocynthiibacter halioticoli]MCW4056129.1 DMT family transporter [Halocynthiibacter sp. SDUM655004]MDE0590895.1 DMT family transporter [Halocynthiibacter sp. C4]
MNHYAGILSKLLSVTIFMGMATCVKAVSGDIPAGEIVFFRSFFALPVIIVWLAMSHNLPNGLRAANPLGHVWRGFMGIIAMGFGFSAIGLLPLPEFTAIGYAAPLLVVIFAAMFLNEKVGVFRLSAVTVGLIGVIVVIYPRLSIGGGGLGDREALGALLALMGACFAALAQVFIRKMTKTETTSAIVFWFSVTGSVMALFTIPFGWVMPDGRELLLLVLSGILGGLGQIFLTTSYRLSDASLVAPFAYASMILSIAVGYFVFDEVPTVIMLIGASIIISAGIAIILRERHLGLKRAQQRKSDSSF